MKKKELKILLVDDEPDILEILEFNLKKEGYQVYKAENGKKGVEKALEIIPHLIVLDVMMPIMNGVEACEKLRENPKFDNTVITFLSARSEEISQVAGLEAGADDYIGKPIKPKLFLSKVKALLRRFRETESESENLNQILGSLEINRETYKVKHQDRDVILPKKEFELLSLLASKPNKVFTRNEILDSVWGNDVIVGDRTIDVHIRKLREKIDENLFKTIKGVGYKLEFDE
jgi:two-component system, OmpR family, alkaline phosphatase synthesis response regulator PhoP